MQYLKIILPIACAVAIIAVSFIFPLAAYAATDRAGSTEKNKGTKYPQHIDNADGTFTNPLIWGDYPDPDVIRVGEYYYLSTTSMHLFPGCPIMRSRDLLNWETISYAVDGDKLIAAYNPDLHDDNDYEAKLGRMKLDYGSMYGAGPWASSLRYNPKNQTYYVLYTCNDLNTTFISYTKDPHGEWDITDMGVFAYDPSLFFDEDGTGYIFCQRTTQNINNDINHPECINLHVAKLAPDYMSVIEADDFPADMPKAEDNRFRTFMYIGAYAEGLRAYKTNGYYYIMHVYPHLMDVKRSENVYGPYEDYPTGNGILTDMPNGEHYWTKQGSMTDAENGEWWSICFQDFGSAGRRPMLVPITWVNDWPVYGIDADTKPVYTGTAPYASNPSSEFYLHTNDYFDADKLSLEWQFNHVAEKSMYSLTERPGYLRMHTATLANDEFEMFDVKNAISQRVQGPISVGTVKMDISQMAEGDVAGLAVFQAPFAYIGVKKVSSEQSDIIVVDNGKIVSFDEKGYYMESRKNGGEIIGLAENYTGSEIWFRADCDVFTERASFYYSRNGSDWIKLGDDAIMNYSGTIFVGERFSIFNFATEELGGYIDVDWFRLYNDRTGNNYTAFNKIQTQQFDDKTKTMSFKNSDDIQASREQIISGGNDGDYVQYNNVNFFGGASTITMRAKSTFASRVDIRVGSTSGPIIAKFMVESSGEFKNYEVDVTPFKGKYPLFIMPKDAGVSVIWIKSTPNEEEMKFKLDGKYLKIDGTFDANGDWFTFENNGNGKDGVYIKSGSSYLAVNEKGEIVKAEEKTEKAVFKILDLNVGMGLSSVNDRMFLCVEDGKLTAAADYINFADVFEVEYKNPAQSLPDKIIGFNDDFESYDVIMPVKGNPIPLSEWSMEASANNSVVENGINGKSLMIDTRDILKSGTSGITVNVEMESEQSGGMTAEWDMKLLAHNSDEKTRIIKTEIYNGGRWSTMFEVLYKDGACVLSYAKDMSAVIEIDKVYNVKMGFMSGAEDYELIVTDENGTKIINGICPYGVYGGSDTAKPVVLESIKKLKLSAGTDTAFLIDNVSINKSNSPQGIKLSPNVTVAPKPSADDEASDGLWKILAVIGGAVIAGGVAMAVFVGIRKKNKK